MPHGELRDYCASRPLEAVADSIVVSPAAFILRVGEVLALASVNTTSARTGARIPVHYAVDPPLAKMEPGGVHALAAGTAYLRVRPLCATINGQSRTPPVTLVRLTIQP